MKTFKENFDLSSPAAGLHNGGVGRAVVTLSTSTLVVLRWKRLSGNTILLRNEHWRLVYVVSLCCRCWNSNFRKVAPANFLVNLEVFRFLVMSTVK